MAIPAKTIDEVLSELDLIIDSTVVENNHLGIFAYVYRRTTAQIKQAIIDKQFEDNERMERLDVAFANLYLTAYQRYTNNLKCSESWKIAFDAKNDNISILQHIILGMNAHINLDLGIATASFQSGTKILEIKNDFLKVNLILNSLINEMQERIVKVSRLMAILDWIGENTDNQIINFSMVKAREQAWNSACYLAGLEDAEAQNDIAKKDNRIAVFGAILKNPPGILLNIILKFVAQFEEKDVKKIIQKLRDNRI